MRINCRQCRERVASKGLPLVKGKGEKAEVNEVVCVHVCVRVCVCVCVCAIVFSQLYSKRTVGWGRGVDRRILSWHQASMGP
jgi:hypothetical protein